MIKYKFVGEHIMEIIEWYNKKNYALILDSYNKISLKSNSQELYILGLVLFELGYVEEGIQILQDVLKFNKSNYSFDTSRGFTYLGLGYFSMGRYDLAKDNLLIASDMHGEFSIESQKWNILLHLSDELHFFYENDYLRFYFIGDISTSDCNKFIDAYTYRYQIIQEFFSVILPKKIDIFIYSSHKDEIGGNLSYANPPLGSIHVYIWEECGHELTHIICFYLDGNKRIKSKFIDEGVAECFNTVKYNNHYTCNDHNVDIFDIWTNYDNYDRNFSHFIACKFCIKLLEQGGKQRFIELICEQTISRAKKIYGNILYNVKDEVEKELLLGINC